MLTKPYAGWTNVVIDSFCEPASYLTDVALDCIKNMNYALKNGTSFIVDFDAEGYEYKVISDNYQTIIISTKNMTTTNMTPEIILSEKTKLDLAKEIYLDVSNNLKEWYKFPGFMLDDFLPKEERETKEYNNYKNALNRNLKTLKERIDKIENNK